MLHAPNWCQCVSIWACPNLVPMHSSASSSEQNFELLKRTTDAFCGRESMCWPTRSWEKPAKREGCSLLVSHNSATRDNYKYVTLLLDCHVWRDIEMIDHRVTNLLSWIHSSPIPSSVGSLLFPYRNGWICQFKKAFRSHFWSWVEHLCWRHLSRIARTF